MNQALDTSKKYHKKTHHNDRIKSHENKVKKKLFHILFNNKILKHNILSPNSKKTIIKKIKNEEDFNQRDKLLSDTKNFYEIRNVNICLPYNQIKFPCDIVFNNCNIILYKDKKDKKGDNTTTIENYLYFYNCTFKKKLKLIDITFNKTLTFNHCNFEREVKIHRNRFLSHFVFINCHDKQNKEISSLDLQENTFEKYFFIKRCTIENIKLQKNDFEDRFYCVDSTFGNIENKEKLDFSNTLFKKEVYFNNSHFKNYVDFHECEFEKTACFYEVTFDEIPNFSQAIFKGNLNSVNTNLNFDFDELETKIKQEHGNDNKKSLDKFANDFRDSFRTFKSALIKDNNLLEASKLHKYELYCKEIELKQSWNKKGKNVENITDTQKNTWQFRDFIEYLLLTFYRKLSDHHTDFLKTFNNLILLIALYSIFIFTAGYKIESNNKNDIILSESNYILKASKDAIINSSFIQEYPTGISIFIFLICLSSITWLFLHIFKDVKVNFKIIKLITFEDIKNIRNLFYWVSFLICILIAIQSFIPDKQEKLEITLNIGIFFIFCIFYLFSICLKSLFLRYIIVCSSYIITIIAMGINIAILNPFIGKLINDSIKIEDTSFIYVTFAYSILTLSVLFSLQKTARKNSIVPN